MVEAIALIVFVTAIAFWWQLAARQKRKKLLTTVARRSVRRSYHCVEIRGGTGACEAVQLLCNRRFLSDEAPWLPLPGCDGEQCNCSFVHFDDRRQHDRRNPYGQWVNLPADLTGERRSRRDRRRAEPTFKPSIAR